MNKLTYTFILTVVFIIGLVAVMFFHSQSDTETVVVEPEILAPLDISLTTTFIDELQNRSTNAVGPDLSF